MAYLEILLSTIASFPSVKQSLTSIHRRKIEMGSYIQISLVALLVTSVVDIGVKGGVTGSFHKIDKDMTEGLSKPQTSERLCWDGCGPSCMDPDDPEYLCCPGLQCKKGSIAGFDVYCCQK